MHVHPPPHLSVLILSPDLHPADASDFSPSVARLGRVYESSGIILATEKKGYIFIDMKTGIKLNLGHFEKEINKWARLLNIQILWLIKPNAMNIIL
jgi:hypothetical protein